MMNSSIFILLCLQLGALRQLVDWVSLALFPCTFSRLRPPLHIVVVADHARACTDQSTEDSVT